MSSTPYILLFVSPYLIDYRLERPLVVARASYRLGYIHSFPPQNPQPTCQPCCTYSSTRFFLFQHTLALDTIVDLGYGPLPRLKTSGQGRLALGLVCVMPEERLELMDCDSTAPQDPLPEYGVVNATQVISAKLKLVVSSKLTH